MAVDYIRPAYSVSAKYPELFTTYNLMEDKATYMSQDEKYVIAKCDGKWMIQRAKYRLLFPPIQFHKPKASRDNAINFRKNKECWKLAYTEDNSTCPSQTGVTWKYKVKAEAPVDFVDAGDGLEVKCEGGIKCTKNKLK